MLLTLWAFFSKWLEQIQENPYTLSPAVEWWCTSQHYTNGTLPPFIWLQLLLSREVNVFFKWSLPLKGDIIKIKWIISPMQQLWTWRNSWKYDSGSLFCIIVIFKNSFHSSGHQTQDIIFTRQVLLSVGYSPSSGACIFDLLAIVRSLRDGITLPFINKSWGWWALNYIKETQHIAQYTIVMFWWQPELR